MGEVVTFPNSAAKAPKGGTIGAFTLATLPANVAPIRRYSFLSKPVEYALSPEGYVSAAIVHAMSDKRKGRKFVDKALDALIDMLHQYHDDPEVRLSLRLAVDLLCYSKTTGRFCL